MKYHLKLTYMITGPQNRVYNFLTVSNLQFDEMFTDVFKKSSKSITIYTLKRHGEFFDATPFVDKRSKIQLKKSKHL